MEYLNFLIYWFFAWVTRTEDAKYKVKQVQRAATWKLGPQGRQARYFFADLACYQAALLTFS